MIDIKFENAGEEPAAFNLYKDGTKIGEMIVEIVDGNMTVYHTEVDTEQENKGYAGQLLSVMVDYAKSHQLKVIPLCQYVHTQFKRHPELYASIWDSDAE